MMFTSLQKVRDQLGIVRAQLPVESKVMTDLCVAIDELDDAMVEDVRHGTYAQNANAAANYCGEPR